MKKHELLKYAYDNYPKGTKYTNLGSKEVSTSSGVFHIDSNGVRDSETYSFVLGTEDKWAEIIPEKPASILDGKVAIQVNNKREFKLLMEHYESKGFKSHATYKAFLDTYNITSSFSELPTAVSYCDYFGHSKLKYWKENGYNIIPFADFAKEVGIKVPVFIMNSEDGVPLYNCDEAWVVYNLKGIFYLGDRIDLILPLEGYAFKTEPNNNKLFFSKEAADKWIEEQNKPKSLTLKLFDEFHWAKINKNDIEFKVGTPDSHNTIIIKPSDLEDMLHAYQSLQ